jgi:hypothetical protein
MACVARFEEGVRPDQPKNWQRFLDALAAGQDSAIVEIAYISQAARDELVRLVRERYPDTIFKWMYFENNLAAANWNCLNDPKRPKDKAEGNFVQNEQWTKLYDIPEGADVLKIFRIPPLINR